MLVFDVGDNSLIGVKVEEKSEKKNELITALSRIMKEVGHVNKNGTNEFHRYAYATAADVMFKLQPLMAENGIVVVQNQKSIRFESDGSLMMIEYEFIIMHSNGCVLDFRPIHTGISAARTSKGTPDDKAANKCHTCARKYFLLSLFQIPTGDYDDPDADGDVNIQKRQESVHQKNNSSVLIKNTHNQTNNIVFTDSIPDVFCEKISSLLKYKGIKISDMSVSDCSDAFKILNSILNGNASEHSKSVIVKVLEEISKRIHLSNSK